MDAYCSDTSTLLFSPQDIITAATAAAAAQHSASPFQFEIRVLQNDTGLQPSPTIYYGMPLDIQVKRVPSVQSSFHPRATLPHEFYVQNSGAADLEAALLRIQSEGI